MDFKLVNRVTGAFVFIFATVIYVMTVQPTFSFWDCGEFIATAYTLGVPHPPGAPFFLIVGKIFMMLPTAADIGLRMNYLSVFSSSACVLFLYLVSTKVIKNWRGAPRTTLDLLIVCGASAIGALSYAFSDSFWFNALETEVYGFGTFLIGVCIYLLMLWWEKADEPGSDRYLLMMAYVVGLSIGIHLIVVQCIIIAGLMFYFRRYEYTRNSMIVAFIGSSLAFFLVYPVIVKKVPQLMQGSVLVGILIVGLLIFGVYYSIQKKSQVMNLAFLSLFLIILGYSTYTSVLLRSNVLNQPIDENNPDNIEKLVSYLNREQYGQQPLFLPRRYSQEPQHRPTWNDYTSDMDFMWKYQINEMFNRYLFWQYIGRESHEQGAGVDFSKLYAIPFLIGMLGVFYHFKKDWKLALVFLVMFGLMGIITTLYQNQQDPQPRERDYFYVGAFFVFSLWIGLGVAAIIEQIAEKVKSASMVPITSVVLAVCTVAVPINMLRVNYHYEDRSNNYFPYDYAYNILQSAEKDAIIFTNGDNDTFPVWCLQAVYGIRTDVRIVNLSLAQTDWYNLQLKNERPYGSLTVPFTMSDDQLKRLAPAQWDEKRVMSLDVPTEAYPDSMRNQPNLPNKLQFNIPATIRQQQGGQVITALKASDFIIYDILKANNWKRPIYFSVTVDNSNYIGLGDYLVMEGMLQRLVPYKAVNELTGIAVNQQVMRKNLFESPAAPNPAPQYGFMFRGLNDPNIFYNQDQERMIETYRTLYLRLAYTYSDDSTKYSEVGAVLGEMEKRLPTTVVDMDYRIKYDIAMLYKKIGNMQKFNQYTSEVEQSALLELEANPRNFQGYYNPYRILIDVYESRGEYQKELEILERLSAFNPADQTVKQKIDGIRARLSGNK